MILKIVIVQIDKSRQVYHLLEFTKLNGEKRGRSNPQTLRH